MRIGIIGRPGVGKQTIFEALTGIAIAPGGKNEDQVGTIQVPDERVAHLSRLYDPRKTTYAQVEYFLPGFAKQEDTGRKESDPAGSWTRIRNCDALIHILRNFTLYGMEDPALGSDFNAMEEEMILADLMVVEKRLDRLKKDQKRGKKTNLEEYDLLSRCQAALERETPLRKQPELASSPHLKGFALLSAKPVMVLLNNPDEDPKTPDLPEQIAGETCISIRGQLERELYQMDKEEAAMFFEEYQIENTAADRVIRHSFAILGLISFFTVGEDEVKAWTIKNDTLAVDAAGAIHSDMKKGFIRAEVLAYNDLTEAGIYKEARKRGTVRLEGKTYAVQDGDIINFRFNV